MKAIVGFEVFVNWYVEGQPARVPYEEVRAAFGTAAGATQADGFRLRYGSAHESFVYAASGSDGMLGDLMIERPGAEPALWESLVKAMRLGNGLCFWPGGRCAVASVSALRHVPADVIDAVGKAEVVLNGADLARVVQEA